MADHPQDSPIAVRGIDREWHEERGDYLGIMAHAPCSAVVSLLQRHKTFFKDVTDLLTEETTLQGDEGERAVYVFQLQCHAWTQLQGLWMPLNEELARWLSEQLEDLVFLHLFQGTSGVYGYILYDRGAEVEEYWSGDTGLFDGSEGAEERRRRIAEGWKIDASNLFQFLSRRGTPLNIDVVEECQKVPNRVAADLGMYMIAEPWGAIGEQPVGLTDSRWRREDFQAAKLIFAKER